MEKKIIAIALVLVLMVTVFVGCGKKYETIKINGQDVLLATDKEGNTIVENNQLAAVVTHRDGEPITFGNGEPQTYYVNVPGSMVIDGLVRGSNFTLELLDGWTSTDADRIIKDKTDNKCYIQFSEVKELEKNEKFADAFAETDKANKEMLDVLNDEEALKKLAETTPEVEKYIGGKATNETKSIQLTDEAYPCRAYTAKIVDKDGNIVHYVETYYFLVDNTIYSINYYCADGVGYDAEFNFEEYLRNSFTFVKTTD